MQYTGPPRGGATFGSCFPPDFGGSCSGTPAECQDCKLALDCEGKKRGEDDLDFDPGVSGNVDSVTQKPGGLYNVFYQIPNYELSGPPPCLYNCTKSGGCTVQYTGPPRGGTTLGSCFPPDFGGSCSGTPPECQECKEAVKCYDDIEEDDIDEDEDGGIINPVLVTPVHEITPEGNYKLYWMDSR